MTVAELLARIIAAYPGATTEAMKTFKPVFYARLQRHEGDKLETAATEVLGGFRPKFGQPFPIPADFEAHLPSGKLDLGRSAGPSIRQWLEDRARNSPVTYAGWLAGQGAKIKANRPNPVYVACQHEAFAMAGRGRPIVLSAEQIKLCEERALSQERVRMFGPPPKSEEAWKDQRAQVRQAWEANPHPVRVRSPARPETQVAA